MLINEEFNSYLNKINHHNNEGSIEKHIDLIFDSIESSQNFLQSLDDNFNTNCMPSFDKPDWKSINFVIPISNLQLSFGGILFKGSLTSIKVSRTESKNIGITSKYTISLKLDQSQTIDTMKNEMALGEFLKRKEPDKKGKKVFVLYKTKISKLF